MCVCTRVVCKHALRLDDDFFEERVSREYTLVVVSEKIDPLKVLLLLFSFFRLSLNWGGEFFLQVLEKRGMNLHFFHKKL